MTAIAFAADLLSLTSSAIATQRPQATSLAFLTGECVRMSASITSLAARLPTANPVAADFSASTSRAAAIVVGSAETADQIRFWNAGQILRSVRSAVRLRRRAYLSGPV